MSETAIRVQGLGKCYTLRHASGAQRFRYKRLSEELTHGLTACARALTPRRRRSGNEDPVSRPSRELFWALRGIDFEVRQGEVVGVIGRNGAGKSTLLKILSRITEPTEGRVRVRGRVASLLEVGTGFHPELTGRENIFLNGTILGMTRREIDQKFDEIVAFAEIGKFLDTPVKRFSSGMYVRLAFSVAAHLDPEILVVDEVLAVGDAEFQKKCLGKMQDVASSGRTVLFVSHNMATIQSLTRRCLVLDRGRIACDDAPAAAVEHYYGQFASGLARPAMGEPRSSKPAFLDVWFEDASGRRVEQLTTSSSITVCVAWANPRLVPGLRVGFGLNDASGARVFGSVPEDSGDTAPAGPGTAVGRFTIPGNTLLPKRYSIDLKLWVPYAEVFQYLQPALAFDVLPGASPILAVDPRREGQVQFLAKWAFEAKGAVRA